MTVLDYLEELEGIAKSSGKNVASVFYETYLSMKKDLRTLEDSALDAERIKGQLEGALKK